MKSYIFLSLAISLEVFGTMMLPLSQNFTKITPTMIKISPRITCHDKDWSKRNLLSMAIKKTPRPAHEAYTTAIGIVLSANVKK